MVLLRNELQLIVNHLIAVSCAKLLSMGGKKVRSSHLSVFAVFFEGKFVFDLIQTTI